MRIMKNKFLLCILILVFLFISDKGNCQIYDGAQNKVYYLGTEVSNYKYLLFGGDHGLTDFLSFGVNLKYMLNPPFSDDLNFIKRLNGELRLDLHAPQSLNLKKSDILIGYGVHLNGLHGPHVSYQYFFTDFFGLFGRANYYVNSPKNDDFFIARKPDAISFEVGIAFKFFNSY